MEMEIKINNLTWKIAYSSNLSKDLFGQTDYESLTILLSRDICSENLSRTLIHELVHAYCYSYGLIFFEEYNREQLCEFISHNIFNLMDIYNTTIDMLLPFEAITDREKNRIKRRILDFRYEPYKISSKERITANDKLKY